MSAIARPRARAFVIGRSVRHRKLSVRHLNSRGYGGRDEGTCLESPSVQPDADFPGLLSRSSLDNHGPHWHPPMDESARLLCSPASLCSSPSPSRLARQLLITFTLSFPPPLP
jgi:hypothetical protein